MDDHLKTAAEAIDRVALQVVTLEPDNIPAWGDVLNHLDEVIGLFTKAGQKPLTELSKSIKSIAEKVVLDELPSPEEGIRKIDYGVGLLQEVLTDVKNGQPVEGKIAKFLHQSGLPNSGDIGGERAEPATDDTGADKQEGINIAEDIELLRSFIAESMEHLGTIELKVLDLEQDPENTEIIDAIFRLFHTIKGVSGFLNLADINRLAHEVETLLDDARDQKLAVDETVTDLILDAVDLLKAMINHIEESLDTGAAEKRDFGLESFLDRIRKIQVVEVEEEAQTETKRVPKGDGTDIGSILAKKGLVSETDLASALEKQKQPRSLDKRIGEILIEEDKVTARDVAGALREQKRLRAAPAAAHKTPPAAGFVKVDTEKLDNIVDMVGELVIAQSMLCQDMSGMAARDKQLYANLSQLGRIISETQRISMSLRMVPIRQTFQKMIRLVRDLSRKSGKQVALEMIGEETEIDRNMVDQIYDPLVHMVRNSVDHGIEKPEVRKAMGKPEKGTVTLKAYHKGGNVIIEVSDDGMGLDKEKIITKALERNLISSGENISDQEIYSLILRPGFSTADRVTDVSGRGVGMDVVNRAIDALRGKLEVHSARGHGTTMLIKLPLTLAIIDGIIVRTGNRNFVIHTASVIEALRPDRSACSRVVNRGEAINIRGTLYPLIRLHELFGFNPLNYNPWDAIVLVLESDGARKCLLVDEIVGKQEVVIKSFDGQLKHIKGITGGAVMADGRIGLILDVAGLFEISEGAS